MKHVKIIVLVFLGLLSLQTVKAQVPFTCKGQFILTLSNNGDSKLALVEVDPLTNVVTFGIINNSMGVDINAIGYRNEENLIYGLDPNRQFLYRVDALGNVETLARLPLDSRLSYFAGDITPDGRYLILIGGTGNTFAARDEELVRVDLSLPGYPVERIPINGPITRIYDIAFNPLTGVLYGFDSNNERLVTVDENTGEVFANFSPTGNVDNAGSLFYDAFGNLFAYGGPFFSEQNRFYAVDTETGLFTELAGGPDAQGTDACSCPYTIEMKKVVSEEWTYPCKEVEYSFIIANGSGKTQDEVNFVDPLPAGMEFRSVIDNPFGGTVVSNPGDPVLRINGMTIPLGIDTIKMTVYVGDLPEGRYFNQARLNNLPISLGQTVLSDEPRTLAEEDSTYIDVRRIPIDFMSEEYVICEGEDVVIDLNELGEKFQWSDGSMEGRRVFVEEQDITVLITAGCDSATIDYTIIEEFIELMIDEDNFEIKLGDTIVITSTVFNSGDSTFYSWYDPDGKLIDCGECSTLDLVPKFSGVYTLEVMNEYGCTDIKEVTIQVDKTRQIFAPNVFSPNGDNINDFFFLMSKDYGKIENLYVFDRWGEMIFRRSNIFVNEERVGWDGLFNGQQVIPGVYTWMAEITFLDEITEFHGGDITVVR